MASEQVPREKILIVEDESVIALNIRSTLEILGYAVVGYADQGLMALKKAEALQPDLVLMDIGLKGDMDGIETARQIREQLDIPIIFLTGQADQTTLQRAKVTEPYGYILKPFEKRELHSSVAVALYKHKTERQLRQSELKHRTLFETMAQGVIYQNPDLEITSANPAAQRILGLSLEQLQGRSSMDASWRAIHQDGSDFPGETHPAAIALKTGKEVLNVVMGVFNPQQKDYVWLSISARPQFREGESKPYQVFATFDDITAIQRAEAALRESEARYRTLIDTSPDAIMLIDLQGCFLAANQQALKLHGFNSLEELQDSGLRIQFLIAVDDRERAEKDIRATLAEGSVLYRDYNALRKDGSVFSLELSASIVRDAENKPYGIMSVSRDITERKQVEQILRIKDSAIASSINAIALADLNGSLTYVNPAFLQLWKYETAAEVLGRPMVEFWRSEGHTDEVIQSLHTQGAWMGELTARARDESCIEIEMAAHLVKEESGKPICIMSSFMDITARKKVQAAEREQRQLAEALRKSAEALNSTLKVEDVLDRALENVGQVLPCDAFAVTLLDNHKLRIARHRGLIEHGLAKFLQREEFAVTDFPGLEDIFITHKISIVSDATVQTPPEMAWVHSYASVPLCIREQMIGALHLFSAVPNTFAQQHSDRLRAFGGQAVMAIENARLFEQTHRLSITDELTGLFNSRYFFEVANHEFVRIRRYGGELSVIMLDVDYFKAVNDRYGHPVGDEVLREIARQIRHGLRQVDVAARYGGEEFVIIMPETGLNEAFQVAERLRKNLHETPITVGQHSIRVSISAGLAAMNDSHPNLNALVKCADDALYAAKGSGRNRVSIWQSDHDQKN